MDTKDYAKLFAKEAIGECDHLPHGACKDCFISALTAYGLQQRREALEEAIKVVEAGHVVMGPIITKCILSLIPPQGKP